MKINIDFSELQKLADQMSQTSRPFTLEMDERVFEPIDIELSGDGVVITPQDIEVTNTGVLSYKGRQVLLYIKDHTRNYDRAILRGEDGNKFHVSHCRTLIEMMERNRYQRYVATNNVMGTFKIGAPGRPEVDVALRVCQNCLDFLNYKGSRDDRSVKKQNAIEFNLQEFFATYSSTFKYLPKYKDDINVGYTKDWKIISEKLRSQRGYQCEECGVNTSSARHLCHVHHRNGVKHDNHASNLEVLCIDCHRKEHAGSMYVSNQDMYKISQLRKAQGILVDLSWAEVRKLIDSAMHGAIDLIRDKGYEAPILSYVIGDVMVEAAWPKRKLALSLNVQTIPGWQALTPNDILECHFIL